MVYSCIRALLVVLTLGVDLAQDSPGWEGEKPYTPTRLEWLAVHLNAGLRVPLSQSSGYSLDFVALPHQNTILIYVTYLPSADRRLIKLSVTSARKMISIDAKARGWSSWLKVEERVEMAEANGK